jgi:hypothetical protein
MAEGYVVDHGHNGGKQVISWIEGAPLKSFWMGLKTGGRRKLEIKTFRCSRCGFLESYAKD